MKKLVIIFFLISITIILSAQNYIEDSNEHPSRYPRQFLNKNHYLRNNNFPSFSKRPLRTTHHTRSEQNGIKHQLDSLVFEEWDENYNQFKNYEKQSYIYNSNGNMISSVIHYWNYNQWINDWSGKYSYDTNNYVTEMQFDRWNSYSLLWEKDYKDEFVYGSAGIVTSYFSYDWQDSTNQWINNLKNEITFDDSGYRIQDMRYKWDEENSKWNQYKKYEYTNNATGDVTSSILYLWSESLNQWSEFLKDNYTYIEGNMILDSASFWDINTDDWRLSAIYEYDYDNKDNLVERIMIDVFFGQTEYEHKNSYTYIDSIPFNSLVLPWYFNTNYWWWWDGQWSPDLFNSLLSEYTEYEFQNGDWTLSGRGTCYYSEINTQGIESEKEFKLRVFPNPASDYVIFSWNGPNPNLDLRIINLNGQIFTSEIITNNSPVSISELRPGLYLYILEDNRKLIGKGKISIQ